MDPHGVPSGGDWQETNPPFLGCIRRCVSSRARLMFIISCPLAVYHLVPACCVSSLARLPCIISCPLDVYHLLPACYVPSTSATYHIRTSVYILHLFTAYYTLHAYCRALQRSTALFFEGTTNLLVQDCHFDRLDGIAVSMHACAAVIVSTVAHDVAAHALVNCRSCSQEHKQP
jgi:hypothetical protein